MSYIDNALLLLNQQIAFASLPFSGIPQKLGNEDLCSFLLVVLQQKLDLPELDSTRFFRSDHAEWILYPLGCCYIFRVPD